MSKSTSAETSVTMASDELQKMDRDIFCLNTHVSPTSIVYR